MVKWLRLGAALALLAGLFTVSAPTAHAQTLVRCEALFDKAAREMKPGHELLSRGLDAVLSIVDNAGRPFDSHLFRTEQSIYRSEISSWAARGGAGPHLPRSPEAKLAFFEAWGAAHGLTGLSLEAIARSENPAATRTARRALSRLDFDKGLSPTVVADAFAKIYLVTHADALSLRTIRTLKLSGAIRESIRQRTEHDLMSHSLNEAFEKLGLLASPSVRERLRKAMQDNPNALATVSTVSLNAFEYLLTQSLYGQGFAFHLPDYSLMRAKPLSPELRDLVLKKGVDAAFPLLKAHYGMRPGFDLAWRWARRFATAAMMAYFLQAALPNALPAGLISDNDGTVDALKKIYDYYKSGAEYASGHRDSSDSSDYWALKKAAEDIANDNF